MSSTFGLGLLGANERKCGDAVIGGDASCTDQINVAFGWTCLAFVAGGKNRGKKNQQQVHRKEQWERIVVCKGQGFREAYIRRVCSADGEPMPSKACFPIAAASVTE